MILWKHHIKEDYPKGVTVTGVGKGGHLHEDLSHLIDYLKKDGREWTVARIECADRDVIPDQNQGTGWYKAVHDIPLKGEDKFISLEEATKKYLKRS